MSLPMIAGLVILAKPIILVFSGEEFLPSVIVLQILSFLLIVIPWSSFLGLQILYPIRKEKYGNYAVIIGALVNLVLNFFLIPRYAYVGVAVSVVCAETVITLAHYIFAMKYMKLKLHDFIPIKSVVSNFGDGFGSLRMFVLQRLSCLCCSLGYSRCIGLCGYFIANEG